MQRKRKLPRIIATMVMIAASAMIVGIPTSASAEASEVCQGLDSGKIDTTGDPGSVTVTAPEGKLIDAYCVKAGSSNQGDGPVYVNVDPPQKTVTISYPGGKAVSHYSVSYTDETPPTDVCPNIDGPQATVPPGLVKNEAGDCVTPPPPPTDVCPNIPGNQDQIPRGLVKDNAGNCVVEEGPPPTDVCKNLAGNQGHVPTGFILTTDGNCIKPIITSPHPKPPKCESPKTMVNGECVTTAVAHTGRGDSSGMSVEQISLAALMALLLGSLGSFGLRQVRAKNRR